MSRRYYSLYLLIFLISSTSAQNKIDNGFLKCDRSIRFTENKGQLHDANYQPVNDVLFYGSTGALSYHLKSAGFSLYQYEVKEEHNEDIGLQAAFPETEIFRTDIQFAASESNPEVTPVNRSASFSNFYLPHCKDGVLDVRSYERIQYTDIYPGIDLVWYGNKQHLEYDFILEPEADYRRIQLEIEGPEKMFLNGSGELVMETPLGRIVQDPPSVFQEGKKLDSRWILNGNRASFEIIDHDPQLAMLIDPIVRQWGTYFGGFKNETILTVNQFGEYVLAGGHVSSTMHIATSGTHQTTLGGKIDGFLTKFDSTSMLVWSTYIGGSDDDQSNGVITDGNVIYVSGETYSNNLSVTSGAYQTTFGGMEDAFLSCFSFINGTLNWATYFGGSSFEEGQACALSGNRLFLTGPTYSATNIATNGAHKTTLSSFGGDGYLACFNPSGQRLWATYLGGNYGAISGAVAAYNNQVFVTGGTRATSGIATANAHQTTLNQGSKEDVFVMSFNSNGLKIWGTYLGGIENDVGLSIAADIDGVYVSGNTESDSGIATSGAHQSVYGGKMDNFITMFSRSGNMQWSTYYGGNEREYIQAQARNCLSVHNGMICLGAQTQSANSISTPDGHKVNYGGVADAYLTIFDKQGVRQWGTYYGGPRWDLGNTCSILNFNLYLAGNAVSTSGIATPGSHQDTMNAASGYMGDAFLVRFDIPCWNSDSIEAVGCSSYTSPSGKYTWNLSGDYTDTLVNRFGCDSILYIQLLLDSTIPIVNLGMDTTICFGSSIILDAGSNGNIYTWYNFTNGQTQQVQEAGKYWVKVTNSCGSSSDTIIVNVRHAPNIFLGNDSVLCIDQSLVLDAYSENATYLWQDGSTGRYYIVTNTGEFWVDVTNPCGQDNDSILALYIDVPVIDLGVDTTIFCPDGITLSAEAEKASYLWSDGLEDSVRFVKRPGNYVLTVTNQCGIDQDTIDIEREECICELYIPNSFTPNNDGTNDLYSIGLNCDAIEFNIIILDRWGEIIYESYDLNFKWDGRSRYGDMSPIGTYVYKIKLTYPGEFGKETKQTTGAIYLLR